MLCEVYVLENKRIICGLLEVLQFEKSYAGEDITFSLKWGGFSDLFLFRSFCSPFKAWAVGLQWPSSIVTGVNEKLVQDTTQKDWSLRNMVLVRAMAFILHVFFFSK